MKRSSLKKGVFLRYVAAMLPVIPFIVWMIWSGDPLLPISALSALLHEAGHIICAAALGVDIKSVRVSLGGITIRTNAVKIKRAEEMMILVSGSFVNMILCILSPLFLSYSQEVLWANLILGIFNLVPCEGLDGGGVSVLMTEWLFMPEKAYKIQKILSVFSLIVIWFFSVFFMIFSLGNISLYCVFAVLFFFNVKAYG